jgi:hypothetical protein
VRPNRRGRGFESHLLHQNPRIFKRLSDNPRVKILYGQNADKSFCRAHKYRGHRALARSVLIYKHLNRLGAPITVLLNIEELTGNRARDAEGVF